MMTGKFITMEEAVEKVELGMTLALGGTTLYRRPVAFVRGLIHHYFQSGEPRDLTLLAFTAGYECDLLVGTGMVARVRTCYFGLEIFGLAPMFTYYANHGLLQIIEETELSISLGLRAQIAQIGFMPGRAWLGTDLLRLRPDVKTILDPYRGEELVAFPAIKPDIAVIHTLRVDDDGNAVIGPHKGADEELTLTADRVILTAEEHTTDLSKSDLIGPLTHHIVLAPRGAVPTSCHPLYPLDGEALLEYSGQVSDPELYKVYIDRWLAE